MRFLLAAALVAALARGARALGEGDEDDAVPGLQSTSGMVLYYDSAGPLSFPSMTPKDVPLGVRKIREVRGRACQRGLAVPIAANFNATNISAYYGNGGYARALAEIKKKHPEIIGLYDVRTDVEVFSILGFYRSLCTVVSARAFAAAAKTE
ncbi:MAG TPA: hypothetical protein VH309_12455 [Elusimicrobiota bacterium]|nr:hypothetical protein [Elusimicrobiota bacterium]